jgi:aryl-alcohol dehydrogenase-like predicted oxidoreductase
MTVKLDPARRRLLAAGAGAAMVGALTKFSAMANAAEEPLRTRALPQTREALPIVGIGTAVIFDFENDAAKYAERRQVIQALIAGGGRLIDTAHSYGRAEERLGELIADLGVRDKIFLATKFSFAQDRAAASASFQNSLRRLKTDRVDLMQAWNVSDANYDFGLLREWKKQGLCRYVGMSISQINSYPAIAKVLAREKPDFFQVNYSLGDREAEAMLLPLAQDVGAAVLTALPFGRNSMFKKAAGRPLPDLAAEIGAKSWAQYFLKFLLSHPAVTAVIPGTDKPEYMVDNLQAGRGVLPDAAMRKRMIQHWESL